MTAYTEMVLHLGHTHSKLAQAKAALELATPDVATALIRVNSGISDIINGKNKATLVGSEMAADDAQIASLTTSVANLTTENAAQDDVIESQGAQITNLQGDLQTFEDELDAKDATITALNGQIATLEGQITEITATVVTLNGELNAKNALLADRDLIISDLNAEIALLQARIAELEAGEEEPNPPPPPPPPPPPAGFVWPDASNTGVPAGTQLTAYTGPTNITANGTVIENKTINTMLVISGDDCIIRNCRIQHEGTYGINANDAARLLVERSTIIGPGLGGAQNAAILGWANVIGCNISGVGLGLNAKGTNLVIKGNYIHDLGWGNPGPHYNGITMQGGTNGALIEDNHIHMPNGNGTAAVTVSPHNGWGNCTNVVINHNKLIGSPGYAISIEKRSDGTAPTGCVATNNILQRGDWGYIAVVNCTVTRSGNVDATSGAAVN